MISESVAKKKLFRKRKRRGSGWSVGYIVFIRSYNDLK
jgi:hypothetical protein